MGVKASKLSKVVSFGSMKRLRSSSSLMAPRRGYIPVAVGVDEVGTKRFMVHTTALCNAEFMELLCRSAEEYGFSNDGILRIPYDAQAFEEWMMTTRSAANQKIIRVQPTTA
ncbi:hypothetical protein BUALT_Bualt04G0061200 [Buddleja alternifolia]|uniref:Small auxin up regulated protein n=1 Tax=Buddleja alternifolia TaxID=168488 RepID=A0AAV6XXB5_9LAMI|nr:hypothetical protein BUALT_Bualt04G0061200 [Buddleja alternifolia]